MKMHPFEKSGLGLAPFRFAEMTVDETGKVKCDHCRTLLKYVFWLASADGKRFKVGSACIKLADFELGRYCEQRKKLWLLAMSQDDDQAFYDGCERVK